MLVAVLTVCAQQKVAANVLRPLQQVSIAKDINGKYDWTNSDDVPILDGGSVNFTATDYTVLIFEKVKPSVVKQKYLSKVTILGEAAKDGVNCQVKLYNRGTIIMPYASDFKPLTVYSEQKYKGTAVNDFGLENSGGFMNTLTEAKLNNQIRSFKLKRGYMVTFSTLPGGRGYSRCFIAADADLEVETLPTILDKRISSYRIFKWYDTNKVGVAARSGDNLCSALNVTSTYGWGVGENMLPNVESVAQHCKENWPTPADLGKATWTAHMKTNNEPWNPDDDPKGAVETVDQVLANWEDLMATGMRLCAPSTHDGQPNGDQFAELRKLYRYGTDWERAFLDSIDARGWRCDIIDLHCYWNEGSLYNNVKGWYDKYKRPIWISEWVWGSSWNNEGIFKEASSRDNPTSADLQRNKSVVAGVCQSWNNADYIERYFYWDDEVNCSRLEINGKLTPTGEYYATINSGLAYKGTSYIPTTPKQKAPSKLAVTYDKRAHAATLTWHDNNGEYNQSMTVERTEDSGKTWTAVETIDQKEAPSDYTYTDTQDVRDGMGYRVHIVNLNGGHLYSGIAYTKIENIEAGDPLRVGDKVYYVGGNILTNSDFNLGILGWTSGTGENIGQPWFQVVPSGGPDGSAYLQAYGNGEAGDASSLKAVVKVNANSDYYVQCDSRNGGSKVAVNVSASENDLGTTVVTIPNTTEWKRQYVTFNTGDNEYVVLSFSRLGAKAQFDKIELREVFATEEAALEDGAACQVAYDNFMADIEKRNRYDYLYQQIDSLVRVANAIGALAPSFSEQLDPLATAAQGTITGEYSEEMAEKCEALRTAVNAVSPATAATKQPQSPSFVTTSGWTVKAGTFTGGEQRTNIVSGKNCWNAWWSGVSASEGEAKTMEVKQTLTGLEAGVYALECKATTEHFCQSDQHGYIVSGEDTGETPVLTYDYFDLPVVGSIWQTLTTTAVYVDEGGSATIGFKSSKKDAVDNAWRKIGDVNSTGDKREGWWCATDFRLLYRPLLKLTVTPGEWGTICLPYATPLPKGARFYSIAGITTDGTKLCLEPLEALAAGQPAIFISDDSVLLIFEEYGEKAENPYATEQTNNLLGHFGSRRATKGSFVLKEGQWQPLLDKGEVTPANTAYISTLSGMTRIDSWTGATMPINTAATAIGTVTATDAPTTTYTIGGRKTAKARGLVIETNGRKTRKIIK